MRKLSVLVIMAALAFAPLSVYAKGKERFEDGGFSGPVSGAQADTIVKALELPDDAPVVLTGTITSQIAGRKHHFMFKDSTGEIMIDVDKKAFRGQTVTPSSTVRISGKVDKDWGKDVEIDVKHVEIVNQ